MNSIVVYPGEGGGRGWRVRRLTSLGVVSRPAIDAADFLASETGQNTCS